MTKVKRPEIFYGWFVVAACFAVTMTLGEAFWSFGVFFKPLENEFGWTRTVTSSAYTAFLIGFSVSLVASGRLSDRYSPRPILLAAAFTAGLGIALCNWANDINQLRIYLFIAGLGAGATWSVPSSTVIRWFHNRPGSGLALSIAVAGVGLGALIFAPLVNYLILRLGWRGAYLTVGVAFFVIIGLAALVIRSPVKPSAANKGGGTKPASVSPGSWRTSNAMTTPAFLGITFVICDAVIVFQAVTVHLVPHATDEGISATTAALALGLMGGASILGRLASGFISDRIGWQKMLAVSLFGMALSIFWLFFLKTTWMLYAFVICYGVFHGFRIPAQVGILGSLFGTQSVGELIGITAAISQLTGAFAPYVAGFVFDKTGNYSVVFIIMMGMMLVGGLLASMIKKPELRAK